jgi:hypothetical protein
MRPALENRARAKAALDLAVGERHACRQKASRFVPLLRKPSSRLHPPQQRPRRAARGTSFLDRPITLYGARQTLSPSNV